MQRVRSLRNSGQELEFVQPSRRIGFSIPNARRIKHAITIEKDSTLEEFSVPRIDPLSVNPWPPPDDAQRF